ncbi:MAG TPA: glycosyltransferase family 2 protein [Bacteroidia bacterium]|jgi:glycosyltransferase involved in cell wall biosynthesis|nr:glycosyltransferase family 2 protein [Bacteroidia bacterium]
MRKEVSKVSIVVPVYNSSKVLYELQKQVEEAFTELKLTYQLVFVDDYSYDDSWSIIKDLKGKFPDKVIAVRLAKNFGQHNAIFCGLRYCSGDVIVTMDDDLQNPPSEIKKLLESYTNSEAEMVYGISSNYKRPLIRKATSRGFKTATKLFSKSTAEGSSFRLLDKKLVKKIITHKQYFVFVDELISWYSSNIEFVNVKHEHSHLKHSRYTGSKLLNLVYGLTLGYNAAPLRFITWLGLLSSFFSFVLALYFLYRKFFHHVRLGYTSIIVSVTLSAGIILLSIGIIGEHLRRMYNILNEQPQFSVSEVIE